jgi:hypothetical protein
MIVNYSPHTPFNTIRDRLFVYERENQRQRANALATTTTTTTKHLFSNVRYPHMYIVVCIYTVYQI